MSAVAHGFNVRVFSELLKTERRLLAHVHSDTDWRTTLYAKQDSNQRFLVMQL